MDFINTNLAKKVVDLRQRNLKIIDKKNVRPKMWSSVEEKHNKLIITIVIPTHGCQYALSESGGCSMCGYINDASRGSTVDSEAILNKIQELLMKNQESTFIHLKIFNSGSFFDEKDVPKDLREKIIDLVINNNVKLLSVENRIDLILEEIDIMQSTIERLKETQLEIGLGLETSNDMIRKDCINKLITMDQYITATNLLKEKKIRVKTYVLLKPPFISEREAIIDVLETVKQAVGYGTDVISINPVNIQKGTLVEELWKKKEYRTSWLWSVLYIIKEIRRLYPSIELICDPVGAGLVKGAHNCGKCDKMVSKKIESSLLITALPSNDFDNICECYDRWALLVSNLPLDLIQKRNNSRIERFNPLN